MNQHTKNTRPAYVIRGIDNELNYKYFYAGSPNGIDNAFYLEQTDAVHYATREEAENAINELRARLTFPRWDLYVEQLPAPTLSDLIREELNPAPLDSLNDITKDFINDIDTTESAYICDAIQEYADSQTSIYYSDIIKFISENVEAVNDAINEFTWNGCGGDLYKAGQMAEFIQLENSLYNDIEDIKKYLAINYLSNIESNHDADALNKINPVIFSEIVTDFITTLEAVEYNDRLEAIAEAVNEFREAIQDATNAGGEV